MAVMALGEARDIVATRLSAYVYAKRKSDREAQGKAFIVARLCFRETYGDVAWRRAFDDAVAVGQLEDYIFDADALREGR